MKKINDLQRKLLEKDLEKADTAFSSLEEIQSLSFDEAKMLNADTFKIWCFLNKDSYDQILNELKK